MGSPFSKLNPYLSVYDLGGYEGGSRDESPYGMILRRVGDIPDPMGFEKLVPLLIGGVRPWDTPTGIPVKPVKPFLPTASQPSGRVYKTYKTRGAAQKLAESYNQDRLEQNQPALKVVPHPEGWAIVEP